MQVHFSNIAEGHIITGMELFYLETPKKLADMQKQIDELKKKIHNLENREPV